MFLSQSFTQCRVAGSGRRGSNGIRHGTLLQISTHGVWRCSKSKLKFSWPCLHPIHSFYAWQYVWPIRGLLWRPWVLLAQSELAVILHHDDIILTVFLSGIWTIVSDQASEWTVHSHSFSQEAATNQRSSETKSLQSLQTSQVHLGALRGPSCMMWKVHPGLNQVGSQRFSKYVLVPFCTMVHGICRYTNQNVSKYWKKKLQVHLKSHKIKLVHIAIIPVEHAATCFAERLAATFQPHPSVEPSRALNKVAGRQRCSMEYGASHPNIQWESNNVLNVWKTVHSCLCPKGCKIWSNCKRGTPSISRTLCQKKTAMPEARVPALSSTPAVGHTPPPQIH